MNNFKTTFTGGMPLYNDDFTFIQTNIKEALKALGGLNQSSFAAKDGFVLWGCVIALDGGDITVTEGAIFLNGEIYYVPAQSFAVPVGDNAFYFQVAATTFDPVGAKEFEDATTHDTYEIIRAELTYDAYADEPALDAIKAAQFFVGIDTANLKPRTIHTVLHGEHTEIANGDLIPSWHHSTGRVEYWKDSAGYVHLHVEVTAIGSPNPSGGAMINLPVGYRPASGAKATGAYAVDFTNSLLYYVVVQDNGDVVLRRHDGTSGSAIIGSANVIFKAGA